MSTTATVTATAAAGSASTQSTNNLSSEFQRADVLFLAPSGDVELRLVAADLASGEAGTETLGRFSARYLSLLQRCDAHAAGLIDLFPVTRRREQYRRVRIPRGGANLGFGGKP